MTNVFVVEGDNNMDYSDHQNWFITVATTLEKAEEYIIQNTKTALDLWWDINEWKPETEHPVKNQESTIPDAYIWEWRHGDGYSKHITVYIYLVRVFDGTTVSNNPEN